VSPHANSQYCPPSAGDDCAPARCQWRCALDVIDELLAARDAISGEEMDRLLDLRSQLRRAEDAEAVLKIFCELRIRMERKHYLAFFRIRRWLENHIVAAVRICPAAKPVFVPVELSHYCVEAIRRVCLCAALRNGPLLAPRLRFAFASAAVPSRAAAEMVAR
jgi:hypothetical protein